MMKKLLLWTPFAAFAGLLIIFALGLLFPSDREVASGMVGRSMPPFSLPKVVDPHPGLDSKYFSDGKPRLLNVFASWCVPCLTEVPVLVDMKAKGVEITGIAIHDRAEPLAKFLADNGDPYTNIGDDADSRTQIAFGSAGVPETFIVDGKGVIRHQHIGIITPNDVPILIGKLKALQ
jgi:cytochrome c biogenesis protein CcmG, thiol:disulfide interchange protein DsbE